MRRCNELPMPYGTVAIELPGGPGISRAFGMGSYHQMLFEEVKLGATFQAPGASTMLLAELHGESDPARVESRLALEQESFRHCFRADPARALTRACRAMLVDVQQATRDAAHRIPDFVWRAPGKSRVETWRTHGGWAACATARSAPLSVMSYLPNSFEYAVHLIGPSAWIGDHLDRLRRPRFREPDRQLLVPFAAECLRQAAALRGAGRLTARKGPQPEAPRGVPAGVDPRSLCWSIELLLDGQTRYQRSLHTLYDDYLHQGIDARAGIETAVAISRHTEAQAEARAGQIPVELDTSRIYPLLRSRREVEGYRASGFELVEFPLVEELVVTLALAIETGGVAGWLALDRTFVEGTVHRPATLLRLALANTEDEFRAAPDEIEAALLAERHLLLLREQELGSFVLSRAGIRYVDGLYEEDAWVCFPQRGCYLFGRDTFPGAQVALLAQFVPQPVCARPLRWGDVRQAALALNGERGSAAR